MLLWLAAAAAFGQPAAPAPAPPCDDYVRWLPALTADACRAAQLRPSDGRSVKGHVLWRRDVGARARDARLRVLVVGGIHGDEATSATLALRWLALAQQTQQLALKARDAPTVAFRFLPVLNPDGMFRPQPQRTNAHGVDLNRNFPTPNWERESRHYWADRTGRDPRRFPGPRPLSEPETRFLHDEMDRFKPHLIVSVHAPYGLLDFDSRGLEPPRKLGHLHLDPLGVFPGSLGNYAGVHRNMPVVTIELGHATKMPDDAEVRAMWRDLNGWMLAQVGMLSPLAPQPVIPVVPPAVPEPPASAPEAPASAPQAPASAPEPAAAAPEAPASAPPPSAPLDPPLPEKPLPFGPETAPPEPPAAPASAPASGPVIERGDPAPAEPPTPPASAPTSPPE